MVDSTSKGETRVVFAPGLWCAIAVWGLVLSGCASAPQSATFSTPAQWEESERLSGDPRVHVPHAQRTIALSMPQFRRCFEHMEASGKISLVLTIDAQGEVARAEAMGPVPREVTQCVETRARQAHFAEPEGGRIARLDVPVAVIRQ